MGSSTDSIFAVLLSCCNEQLQKSRITSVYATLLSTIAFSTLTGAQYTYKRSSVRGCSARTACSPWVRAQMLRRQFADVVLNTPFKNHFSRAHTVFLMYQVKEHLSKNEELATFNINLLATADTPIDDEVLRMTGPSVPLLSVAVGRSSRTDAGIIYSGAVKDFRDGAVVPLE